MVEVAEDVLRDIRIGLDHLVAQGDEFAEERYKKKRSYRKYEKNRRIVGYLGIAFLVGFVMGAVWLRVLLLAMGV